MLRSPLRYLHLVGPVAAAAALVIGSLPALALAAPMAADCSAIHFELANPGPGSNVTLGRNMIQGMATDTRSLTGMGIDRIDFFLENRDLGGLSVGTAAPGLLPGPSGPGSFQASVSFPKLIGGHELFAYAHSSVTGQESILDVPIVLGDSDQAMAIPPPTTTHTCSGSANGTSITSTVPSMPAAPSTAPVTPPSTTIVAPGVGTIMLQVGNPSPADVIRSGAFTIQGTALDRAAQQGSGIDRIDIFLDNRDQGGLLLGQATLGSMTNWTAVVKLPNNHEGLHALFFYAHSAVSGQVLSMSVPVEIET